MAVSILQARKKPKKKAPPPQFDKTGEVPVRLELPSRKPGYYLSSEEELIYLDQAAKDYERNKDILPKEFAQMYGGKAKEHALQKLVEHSKNPDKYNNETVLCFNKDGSVLEETFDGSKQKQLFSAEDFSISKAATSSNGGKASGTKGAQGGGGGGNRRYQDKVSEEKSEEPDGDDSKKGDSGDEHQDGNGGGNGGGKGNPVDGKNKEGSHSGEDTIEVVLMCIKKPGETGFDLFTYTMKYNDQLAHVFDEFVEERGFEEEDDPHFLLNNKEIYYDDTPADLKLTEDDMIHVLVLKAEKSKDGKPKQASDDDFSDVEESDWDSEYEEEVSVVKKKPAAVAKAKTATRRGKNTKPTKNSPKPQSTSPKSQGVKLDNRRGRGNRKVKAWSHATTAKRQMCREVRDKLDACADPVACVQAMSRPRHRAKGYNEESDTESVMNARDFPHVLPGLFLLTEQRPNGNGNVGGRKTKKPTIHFMTGSTYYTEYLRGYLCEADSDTESLDVAFHDDYDDFKTAIFDHDSIAEAQVNKKKNKRSVREDVVNGKGKKTRR